MVLDSIEWIKSDDTRDVLAGIAIVRGAVVAASPPELEERVARARADAKARPDSEVEPVRIAVRSMLRHGRYKPTGRAKPASEYLLAAAREDRFPAINNLVDINNLISLDSLLPISIIDLERVPSDPSAASHQFALRRGRAGESYVFNDAGQTIELADLLLVSTMPGDVPCANPVKDSMVTKVASTTRDALGVIYAPRTHESELIRALDAFADELRRHSGASEVVTRVV
jgi:DNA/RNA-binding domain of Phe-tRNA-synthetase-like protein